VTDRERAAALVAEIEALLGDLDGEALLALRGDVARLDGRILTDLLRASSPAAAAPGRDPERFLGVKDLAARLDKSADWIYRNRETLPFPAHTVGGEIKFRVGDVERYFRRIGRSRNG
jgi:hypothetical protein